VLATGALVGLVTLVRPVTLALPAFVLAALLLRSGVRPALRATALLSLGMGAVVLPWTARNHAVSGRFVPVNLQAGVVAWAATEKPLPWDADHYLWFEVGPELMRVHTRVTGRQEYDLQTFERHLPELEAEYRREAAGNLARQPGVYARNVARAAYAFLVQASTALPRAFVRLQREPAPRTEAAWFRLGAQDELRSPGLAVALRVLYGALTLLAAAGLALGLRAREAHLLGPVALAACVGTAHALTHLDLMHHYLRVPFVIVLAFYAVDRLAPFPRAAVASALAAGSAALTARVLFP
jgi:prepilin signal peptidase PulO-like enzyme (type II secretory pathway)